MKRQKNVAAALAAGLWDFCIAAGESLCRFCTPGAEFVTSRTKAAEFPSRDPRQSAMQRTCRIEKPVRPPYISKGVPLPTAGKTAGVHESPC
ncbi:MAG: hypothetical protein BGO05_05710 [Rhizobiales bacterium 63-7]|nr:hypothetical protein [Hyphomicrobiales bacterium]OJU66689.1 MAG: hypothetical protein BGO05_05710 [Rhizobiales bacterium 63-7]